MQIEVIFFQQRNTLNCKITITLMRLTLAMALLMTMTMASVMVMGMQMKMVLSTFSFYALLVLLLKCHYARTYRQSPAFWQTRNYDVRARGAKGVEIGS